MVGPEEMCIAMKQARESAGLSQRELAKKSGILQCQLSKWENGACEPSIFCAMLVTEVLGISIDQYIGRRTA